MHKNTVNPKAKVSHSKAPKVPAAPRSRVASRGRTLKAQNLKLALKAVSGLCTGSVYPLLLNRNLIGRRLDVAVPLDDAKVSRDQAAIDCRNGFYYLIDLGSTNGTYLNDQLLEAPKMLKIGDRIRVGSTVFGVEPLDTVKLRAAPNWSNPTRAIRREDVIVSPAPERSDKKGFARWAYLQEGAGQNYRDRAKFILVLSCLVVILAALVTSFI